jgi:hypothetical protein
MATRLNRFSLPIAYSTRAHVLYSSFGKNFGLLLLLRAVWSNRNNSAFAAGGAVGL